MSSIRKTYGIESLYECLPKFGVLLVTLIIGLACGYKDSYASFYLTVMVQSLANSYDSASYLKGYDIHITVGYVLVFIFSVIAFTIAVLHFTAFGKMCDNKIFVIIIGIILSAPLVISCVQAYLLIKNKQY
ncbi:MAG: hypothetical protein IJT38_05635 [Clostridia bacterium]|nr:hypothetical protein [Clostridia bacterium]